MPIDFAKIRCSIVNVPLRWALIVPFVLPTIAAVMLVGYLSYSSGQAAVADLGRQLVNQTNDRVTQELKTYLQAPILVNRLNVDAVERGQIDPQNVSALEMALFDRLQQFEQVSTVLFLSPQGQLRLVERQPNLYLGASDPPRPDVMQIYRLDDQGSRGELVTTIEGLDLRRDRDWYHQAVTTGQPEWGAISQYGTSEAMTLNASQPAYDRSTNRLLGVFAVHLRFDYLSQFLHGLNISRVGQVLLLDQSNTLIATSTQEQLFKPAANTKNQLEPIQINESQNRLTRSIGEYLRDYANVLDSLAPSQLEFHHGGKIHYIQIAPFQDQYGLNWRIVTVIPKSHFLAGIQESVQTTVLLCLLTLGVAIALGVLAADRLTFRFVQLNRASREFAAGRLDRRLLVNSSIHEINRLAQTFNQMADQLQYLFDRIQSDLEESEVKFITIFRASPDPIVISSFQDGRLIEVNDALLEFYGYSRSEIIGHTIFELDLWRNLEEREHYRGLLKQQGRIRNAEVQLQTKSGEVKTVLLSAEVRSLEEQDCVIAVYRDISDRKQTEEALRQSEALNHAILNALPDLILRVHQDGTYLNIKRTTAFPIEFPNLQEGENIRNVLPPEVAQHRLNAIATALETEEMQVSEYPLWVQGQYVWQEARVIPLNANEVLIIVRDLTQRKRFEDALRQSEANLLQAQRIANLGSWEFNLATQKLTWSEELFRITGRDSAEQEPSVSEILAAVPPEDQGVLQAAFERAIADGTPYEVEHRIRHADGTLLHVVSKGQSILNDWQQVIKVYGTVLDITDRKRAEAALSQSEERFREIAETINDIFYIFSADLRQLLYVSPAYETISGYARENLYADQNFWEKSMHPDDRSMVHRNWIAMNDCGEFRAEYRTVRSDGEIRWIKDRAFPIYGDDGQLLRVVGIAEDFTDRKQLEQSLRSQAEEERLLATITQNIRQSLDLDQILATTVGEVQQTLQSDRALIFQLHPDGTGQVIQEATLPNYPVTNQMCWEDEHFPIECHRYYQQGKPRIVPNVALDEWAACLTEFMQKIGVKSKIVAPIVRTCEESSSVWGLLIVHACSHYRQWQSSEADFLQKICNQLAIAIDQSSLYQQLQTELAERKQAEAALQERETMLRAIGDNLPKGYIYQRIYEPGKGSHYSYVSAGIERLLGLKPETVLANPKAMRSIGFDEDLAIADCVAQESLEKLTPIELQMRNRTTEGKIQWSSIRSVPRRLTDGRTVWDGIEVDITDLKRTEAALRTSEEQFRRAFDDAPIGVSLISQTGQYVKVNTCYCNLLEYTEAELLSLTFQEITHPSDLEADLAGLEQMVSGKSSSLQMTKRYITKQGAVVPVLLNAAPIRDQDGQLLYVVAHIQDIRDRLKIERMKDEFISVVSHELRTPLTSIRGALGILGSGVFSERPEKAQRMLNIAIDNSDRLVALVNDILTLERLESGKVELVIEPCRVADLMQQAVDSVQAIADQSNITISCTSVPETLWVASGAIVQTLTNLLGNAIKFSSPDDTVWLKAEAADRSQFPMPHILFTVKDQGRGIPEDKLEVIFEQFQQVDVSDAREKGGTGLGLTICKKTVQQHGGQIWVESILGEGSTFYVALPLMGKGRD